VADISTPKTGAERLRGFAILLAIYCAIVYLLPKPETVKPEGWRLFGIFIATVVGSIIEPIPGGALVLLAVTLSSVLGGLTLVSALGGYGDPTVWLVMAAFFISRALINTGLARRIALFFVRLFGRSSLGVSYALCVSDTVLAAIIPSNGARSGGVILPITRSIAELYGSQPGATSAILGSFLITSVYQGICISSSMFFTGQASNALAAGIATSAGYSITWSSWFLAGLVPGLLSMLVVPWVVLRLNPPQIRQTPKAREFADGELQKLGPLSKHEKILTCVFIAVCGMWVTSGMTKIDVAIPALLGAVFLIATGTLSWEDVRGEKAAWDIFIWYGGLVRLGKALNDTGVTTAFAKWVASAFSDTSWVTLFTVALLVYFYAHYAFASITAHILAMYPAFLAVLAAKGAPLGLVAYAFACFTNLAAGLTHYGTTPSPMFYAHGYVPMSTWWRVGAIISIVNITIWSTAGFAWWKLVGFW
jgi:DASS family divalent anion:Na+ symporter